MYFFSINKLHFTMLLNKTLTFDTKRKKNTQEVASKTPINVTLESPKYFPADNGDSLVACCRCHLHKLTTKRNH